jgi:hypothetical protein
MSTSPEPFSFVITTRDAAVSSTSSSVIVQRFDLHSPPPDQGFHVEARIAAQPSPLPSWTTGEEHHELVGEAIMVAATIGVAIVGWRIRRGSRIGVHP